MGLELPVGICPTTIGVTGDWWLAAARKAEEAGVGFVGAWDHLVSRGDPRRPVLECWTLLAAAAGVTTRVRLGSFVTDVLLRPPQILARMAATVAEVAGPGRLDVGIGSGGHEDELRGYGFGFPPASERLARLEEAVTVLRRLWTGGPVDLDGRFTRLEGAHAFPSPQPPPRVVVAGGTPASARLAARVGDAWTCPGKRLDALLPVFVGERDRAGRAPDEVPVVVGLDTDEVLADPVGSVIRWRERGAEEVVLHWVRARQLDPLLEALARA